MGFFSVFKRKARTRTTSFSSYRSPRVSYRKPVSPRPTQESDRASRRRSERSPLWLYLKILLGILAVGALTYLLFFTKLFEIRKIDIVGEADTTEEQAAVSTYFQDKIGENLLFFKPSEHEAVLLEEYSYLKTLDIRRSFFHTIRIILKTYPSVANVRVDREDGGQQFFVINEKGTIASQGTALEALPLIVMDVTGTDLDWTELSSFANSAEPTVEETVEETEETQAVNEELINPNVLSTLLETADSFEAKFNLQILEIRYLKRARELHLLTERYFYVWIDLTQDPAVQLAKLKKALTELNIYDAPLEYIDLRISGQSGEKVIYKVQAP